AGGGGVSLLHPRTRRVISRKALPAGPRAHRPGRGHRRGGSGACRRGARESAAAEAAAAARRIIPSQEQSPQVSHMQLQFLGATGTVTGSKYVLRHEGAMLMVDCGLFQGYKQLRLRNWKPLPVAPSALAAVILTHAHIDHSGYLPL